MYLPCESGRFVDEDISGAQVGSCAPVKPTPKKTLCECVIIALDEQAQCSEHYVNSGLLDLRCREISFDVVQEDNRSPLETGRCAWWME